MDLRRGRTGRAVGGTVAVTVAVTGAAVGAWAAALVGCSSLDCATPDGTSGGSSGPDGSAAVLVHRADSPESAPGLELRSRVTRVAGFLADGRRERVAGQLGAAVEEYLVAAFADGDRRFRGFVPGLRRAARRDASVLSDADGVGVTTAAASFSVAAPHGRVVGATARVLVELGTGSGGTASTLTGRLLLTKDARAAQGGEWQVFGYDLARGKR